MDKLPKLNNVKEYLSKDGYFELLVNQISKDFLNEGFDQLIEGIQVHEVDRLEKACCQFLEYAFSRDQEGFMQLMYKIDIPDADFKLLLDSPDFYNDLTDLIIKRELLKVVIRRYYSE